MNGLDLFSGIGGITLALSEYVKPVAYCENDRYAQAVLLSRMSDGRLPRAPIWDDVTTLKGNMLPEIDVIYGGFPCQDISAAGKGIGLMAGERSGLFFEIARLVSETNPKFIFLENVPTIRTRGLNSVVQTFTELGYDCRWTIVSAAEVGACHIRKRWFILAHANGLNLRQQSGGGERSHGAKATRVIRNKSEKRIDTTELAEPCRYGRWTTKPSICRGTNGVQNRMDRIKCLGNSVVPLQAKVAFEKLMGIKQIEGGE